MYMTSLVHLYFPLEGENRDLDPCPIVCHSDILMVPHYSKIIRLLLEINTTAVSLLYSNTTQKIKWLMKMRSWLQQLLQIQQSAIYLNGANPIATSHVAGQCDCADIFQSSNLFPQQKQSLAEKFPFALVLAKLEQNQPIWAWEIKIINKKMEEKRRKKKITGWKL